MKKITAFLTLLCALCTTACLHAQTISTIAGTGTAGFTGDGGGASGARINYPEQTAMDIYGNLYLVDRDNNRIRKITPAGTITTIAGSVTAGGYGGDGGPATAARLFTPIDVAVDVSGNVYIADMINHRIRKVSTSGIITTIAGTGTGGYSGDGGPATAANLSNPRGVVVGRNGKIYIADQSNYRIRLIDTNGIISTIAGTGTSGISGDGGPATAANMTQPTHVAIDSTGNLYVVMHYSHRIRKIDTFGIITTIAGTGTAGFSGDGGPATAATINGPWGVSVDRNGMVYIPDFNNNRIRTVDASGNITTIAGTGIAGFSGDGGPATAARFDHPGGVSIDSNYNIYICDAFNQRVRKIASCLPVPGVISGSSTVCAAAAVTLTSTGTGGTWSSGAASIVTVNSSGVVTGLAAGTATIYYTVTNTCGTVSAAQTITVNPLPVAGTITGAATVCQVATTTLSTTGTGGTWSSGTPGIGTISSSGAVTGVTAGTTIISYTVTNGCGSATDTQMITVNPLPVAGTISGGSTLCVSTILPLSTTGTGGLWYSSAPTIAPVNSIGAVLGAAAGTATITYGVTNACGTAYATYPVTVNPLPVAGSISGATAVCATATLALTTTGTGGVWSSGATGIATVNSSGTVTGITAGTATISYTVTNSCGAASATQTVTVNPLPVAGTLTGSSSICVGGTTALSTTGSGGVWSSGATGIATVNSSGVVTGVAAGTAVITYMVTNSCGTTSATRTITVNTLPVAGTITGPTTVCAGAAITMTTTGTGGGWSTSAPGIATVSIGGTVTGISAGTAIISYTVINSCATATATHAVTVNPLPVAGTISGTTSICLGTTSTLSATSVGGTWSTGAAGVATVSTSGVVTGVSIGSAVITYTTTNICGSAATTLTINVIDTLSSGIISGPDSVCAGDAIVLTNTTTGGSWTSSNSALATVSSSGMVTGVASGSVLISYSVANACGTSNTTHQVYVKPLSSCVNGIAENNKEVTVGVYPNPNTGSFHVALPANANEITILLFDVYGKLIDEQKIAGSGLAQEYQFSNLTKGGYFVRVMLSGSVYVQQVTVW